MLCNILELEVVSFMCSFAVLRVKISLEAIARRESRIENRENPLAPGTSRMSCTLSTMSLRRVGDVPQLLVTKVTGYVHVQYVQTAGTVHKNENSRRIPNVIRDLDLSPRPRFFIQHSPLSRAPPSLEPQSRDNNMYFLFRCM